MAEVAQKAPATHEEILERVTDNFARRIVPGDRRSSLARNITQTIHEAMAAEREACAKLCNAIDHEVAEMISERIRARGNK